MRTWAVIHVEPESVALLNILTLSLSRHHEVLILLELVVMDARSTTLLTLLHGRVHQLVGLRPIIIWCEVHLVVSVFILFMSADHLGQVAIWRFVVLLRGRPWSTLLLLHLQFVVLHYVSYRNMTRLLLVLHWVLKDTSAIHWLFLILVLGRMILRLLSRPTDVLPIFDLVALA